MSHRITGHKHNNGLFNLGLISNQLNRGRIDPYYVEKGYGTRSNTRCSYCGHDLHRYAVRFDDLCLECWDTSDTVRQRREKAKGLCNDLLSTKSPNEVMHIAGIDVTELQSVLNGKANKHLVGRFDNESVRAYARSCRARSDG